jgi:hypothetical protein
LRRREQEGAEHRLLERRMDKEREELQISSEVYRGLGKQCAEKANQLEELKFKVRTQESELQ